MANVFDQFDDKPAGGNIFDQFDDAGTESKPKKRSAFAVANDAVIETANAAAGGIGAISSFVSPGNRFAKGVDRFIKSGEEKQSDIAKAGKAKFRSELEAADTMGGEVGAVGRYVRDNPLLAASQAAGSIAGPGIGTSLAKGVGIAAKLSEKASTRLAQGTGIGIGGAMGGGDAGQSAYDLVQATPSETLAANPEARTLFAQGKSEAEVRDILGTQAARKAMPVPTLLGLAAGAVGAEKLIAGAGKAGSNRIARALTTGAVEGTTEGIEEGSTNYFGRLAASEYDPSIDPLKGTAGAAAMGAVLGAGVGGGIGALTPNDKLASQTSPPPEEQLIAGLLTNPASTGTPSDQILTADVERANAVAAAQANADALYASRAEFEASQTPSPSADQTISGLLTSPVETGTPSDQVLTGDVGRANAIDAAQANADAIYRGRDEYEAKAKAHLGTGALGRAASAGIDSGAITAEQVLQPSQGADNGVTGPVAAGLAEKGGQGASDNAGQGVSDVLDTPVEPISGGLGVDAGGTVAGVQPDQPAGNAPNGASTVGPSAADIAAAARAPIGGQLSISGKNSQIDSNRLAEPVTAKASAKPPIARVGTTPKNAEEITVKDGVVYMGKFPVQHFETGEDITVGENADFAQVKKALQDGGALSSKQKVYPGVFGSKAKPDQAAAVVPSATSADITGNKIDNDWTEFNDASGTLGINRAEMPQIKAENRGAMVNFLTARGISSEQDEVSPDTLKATQKEFSRAKVEKAKGFTGNDRSILVSSDGYVLDGHHQWLAKRETGKPVKVIRLDAPIKTLLDDVKAFPSAQTDGAPTKTPSKLKAMIDARLANKEIRGLLPEFAKLSGWAERGGSILRDANTGEVTGRTKWVPRADWWTGKPSSVTEKLIRSGVPKALNAQPITKPEREAVDWLMSVIEADIAEMSREEVALANEIADDVNDIPFDAMGETDPRKQMEAMGFSDGEINEILEAEGRKTDEVAARPAQESNQPGDETQAAKTDQEVNQDRRQDTPRRQKIADMTPEEMRRELLVDAMTGLGNRRAYQESEKLATQVSIDADGLKWINDNLGHESGDRLLETIGKVIAEETTNGFHISGDEYVIQTHTKEEADAIMARVVERLNGVTIEGTTTGGEDITLRGIGISYGINGDLNNAEKALREHKAQREREGLRGGRGAIPPNAVIGKQGGQDQQNNDPAEEEKPALELTGQTPAQIAAAEAASKKTAEKSARDDAKPTGPDVTADQVDLFNTQRGLFNQPTPKNEFIKAPDGSIDFGEITAEQSGAIKRQAGKIRLEQGVQNADGSGNGLAHIEARHGKEIRSSGYNSIESFVSDAVRHIDAIWKPGKTSQLIAVQSGNKGKVTFIELQSARDADGDYYRVNSAFPATDSYINRKEKNEGWKSLWSRDPVSANASGASGFVDQSPNAGETTPTVSPQSDAGNIAPDADQGKSTNTEDSGAELAYNLRNRRTDGLKWADIADKEAALRISEVTKAKVYPKPDYAALAEKTDPVAAHLLKQLYDSIATAPVPTRGLTLTDAHLQAYIAEVNRVMDAATAWAGKVSYASQFRPEANGKSLLETVYPEGWQKSRAEVMLLGGNKLLGALQPGRTEIARANKSIAKGWPSKIEAWQTQGFKLVESSAIKVRSSGVGDQHYVEIDGRYQRSYPTKTEADAAIKGFAPWLLLNKRGSIVSQHDTQESALEAARAATKRDSKNPQVSDKGIAVTAAERVGNQHRLEGEDIDSDRLRSTFGFKGVNFGTWMKGKANEAERQLHLNHAYDSFMDLAEVLDVPPKAVSLNGMLGLAIGAQGRGGYAAHFVPGVNEINLTRGAGAGSLAHEFGHALDHYFARLGGLDREKTPFLTEHTGKPAGSDLRPEIMAKFQAIVKAMNTRPQTRPEYVAGLEKRIQTLTKNVDGWLKRIRRDFTEVPSQRVLPADAAIKREKALAKLDEISTRIRAGSVGDGKIAIGSRSSLSPAVAEIAELFKDTFGRKIGDTAGSLQSNVDALSSANERLIAAETHEPQLMVSTDYATNATKLDQGKSKAYWSTNLEKFARAFDAYVSDAMEAKAAKNTYLSHAGRTGETVPTGKERTAINQAFAELVSTIDTKETDTGTAMFQPESAYNTGPFYSQLSRAIESAPEKVFTTATQFKLWLNSNAAKIGVKKDEIVWSGIEDYLDMRGKGKVSKADVVGFLSNNGVRVEDAVLGDIDAGDVEAWWNDEGGANEETPFDELTTTERSEAVARYSEEVVRYREGGAPKFATHIPPGGIPGTYREILVTLPSRASIQFTEFDEWAAQRQKEGKSDSFAAYKQAKGAFFANERKTKEFVSSHFDQPNILVHLRTDEVTGADGKRYMRVIEVQSDWGQAGKKSGFDKPTEKLTASIGYFEGNSEAEVIEAADGNRATLKNTVPQAPFVTDTRAWVSLGIKRAIQHAVSSGVDGIVFATGRQNADLYDLSKQVKEIIYAKSDDGKYVMVEAYLPDGGELFRKKVPTVELPDVVGKDVAQKIADGKRTGKLSGLDLKVGGEGMRKFYDEIVPSVANDVLKKLGGGKVAPVQLGRADKPFGIKQRRDGVWIVTRDGESYGGPVDSERAAQVVAARLNGEIQQPGFLIPESLKAKVQTEGLPLFQPDGSYDPYQTIKVRPNTTPKQLSAGRAALNDAEKRILGRNKEGFKLLGSNISTDFRRDGGVSLVGQEVNSPEDLAFVAQVLRDPGFETFRVFFTDAAGKIVDERVYSSRLAGAVYLPKNHAAQIHIDMRASGATGYWLLHNHPSGSAEESRADLLLTAQIAEATPGFKGHVVIDHNEFNHISVENGIAKPKLVKAPQLMSIDLNANPEKPHPLLGEIISGPSVLAGIAKRLQTKDGYVVLIGTNAQQQISLLTEVPVAYLKGIQGNKLKGLRAVAAIKRATGETGSTSLFAAVPGDILDYGILTDSGILRDVVSMTSGESAISHVEWKGVPVSNVARSGGKSYVAQRDDSSQPIVEQPSTPYRDTVNKLRSTFGKPQTGPASQYAEQNRRIREEHIKTWDKAKKWMKRQLSPGGLLPNQVFAQKIERDSEFGAIELDVTHMVGALERAIKADYKLSANDIGEKTERLLSDVMAGKLGQDVPEKTKTALLGMRHYIDGMTVEYLNVLEAQKQDLLAAARNGSPEAVREAAERASLMDTIASNVGRYVHRSYRAFDDKAWAKKVPDAVLDTARKYLMERYAGEANAANRVEVILNEILKHGTAYENMEAFVKEAKLGAKDLSVLKKREDIAPEIRALLGEYTDPRINFSKSATKMGRLIWNQRFLDRVRELGMGEFLFTDETKPPEATVQIAGEKSDVYAPLNGLWVTPEVAQAFKDAMGKEQMADWYRTIVQVNGAVKYGKTVLSPTTAARNWMSSFFFTVANGHFDMRHMRKSVAGFQEYFGNRSDVEKLAYLRELKQLGVVYDTPYAGEMMRLLADSEMADTLIYGKGKMKLKNALGYATKFYQYGDDFWKIIGFENEKQMFMDAGLSEQAAKVKAAERIRNTYPTYSMIGKGIQSLRRFPLVGTFVSFPAEIIRTSFNMVRYLAEDYKDPKMRPRAMKRAVGLAIASSFAYALQAASMAMLGYDDDDEEAIRQMAAPWQRNSNLLFTGRDEKGNIRFIDMSFLDPYNYWKRPIVAVTRGQPWREALKDVAGGALLPFFGTDILAGSIFDILANKKDTGGTVYREHDNIGSQVADIANHLRKSIQPGIAANMERTYKAMNGDVTKTGKTYDMTDEAFAWFGWRVSTLDPKVALFYRSFDFKDAKSSAEKHVRDALSEPKDVSDDSLRDSYGLTVRLRDQAYTDMGRLVEAAMESGMSRSEIVGVLKNSGVSGQDIMALMSGRVPTYKPTPQVAQNIAARARNTFGPEAAKQVMERYRSVRSYASP